MGESRQTPGWLPNAITAVRLVLLPAVAATFLGGERTATFALLAVIAASDWLDGFVARRWHLATPLGAVLDPLADKLTQFTLLVLLAWGGRPEFGTVPRAFVGVVLARELFLVYGALRVRSALGKVEIRARWQGKLSTLLVFLILFAALVPAPQLWIDLLAYATMPIVAAAGWRYYQAGRAQVTAGGAR